jgi:hypothetical protein
VRVRHLAILAVWTFLVMLVTGAALFLFTYGDCFDNEACQRTMNRNFGTIMAIAFIVYWAVFIAFIRRWNRD